MEESTGPFNTPEFKQLKKIWDEKLKDSGFCDVERSSTPNDFRDSTQHAFIVSYARRSSNEEYYTAARAFLHECKFACKLHKRMWELHSEGYGYRRIAKEIGQFSRLIAHRWIGRYKRLMLSGVYESKDSWRSEAKSEVSGYGRSGRRPDASRKSRRSRSRQVDRRTNRENDRNRKTANRPPGSKVEGRNSEFKPVQGFNRLAPYLGLS